MLRRRFIALITMLLVGTLFAASKGVSDDHRYVNLLKELRCLVCQNQDLSDSHAPLAKQLRQEVQRLMAQGQADDAIRGYLVQRYGEFILFKPLLKASTALLWFGPGLFLVLGVAGLFILVMRRNRT